MVSPTTAVSLCPEVAFPKDPGIPALPRLFDAEWVWGAYCERFGEPGTDPRLIHIRQFAQSLGRVALVSYEVEWRPEEYLPSEHLAIRIERDRPMEFFRYPDDHRLPGLSQVAHPESTFRLLNRHVLAVRARRARVELIRYRPASRAVLRHSVGRTRFYARVMRTDAFATLLSAQELVEQSAFVVPRLAGRWEEGGVVWFSEIPGRNLRELIRAGKIPDLTLLLDGLHSLWSVSHVPEGVRTFNLKGAYRRAKRSFIHNVRDDREAQRSLRKAIGTLDPFVRSWRPIGIAHNDFYDDQMLVLRDGRIALVDFEEAGPGDPMLDVGNILAHLRWSSRFGSEKGRSGSGACHQLLRQAALERFRWPERDLAYREAMCLFRTCTNTIRRPRGDWHSRLRAGLSLVNETLE